jgi:hypothetical protein
MFACIFWSMASSMNFTVHDGDSSLDRDVSQLAKYHSFSTCSIHKSRAGGLVLSCPIAASQVGRQSAATACHKTLTWWQLHHSCWNPQLIQPLHACLCWWVLKFISREGCTTIRVPGSYTLRGRIVCSGARDGVSVPEPGPYSIVGMKKNQSHYTDNLT